MDSRERLSVDSTHRNRRRLALAIALSLVTAAIWYLASARLSESEKALVGDWRVTVLVPAWIKGPAGDMQKVRAAKRQTNSDYRFAPDRSVLIRFQGQTNFNDDGSTWVLQDDQLRITAGQNWWKELVRFGRSIRNGTFRSPYFTERYVMTTVAPDERKLVGVDYDLEMELHRLPPNTPPITSETQAVPSPTAER